MVCNGTARTYWANIERLLYHWTVDYYQPRCVLNPLTNLNADLFGTFIYKKKTERKFGGYRKQIGNLLRKFEFNNEPTPMTLECDFKRRNSVCITCASELLFLAVIDGANRSLKSSYESNRHVVGRHKCSQSSFFLKSLEVSSGCVLPIQYFWVNTV